jgi:ParB/RepB/Spo0J family partition protein
MARTKKSASALVAAAAVASAQVQGVPLEFIVTSSLNPRKFIDDDKLLDLAANIKAQGLLMNLILRPNGAEFEVIAGERRLRALRLLREAGGIPEGYLVDAKVVDVSDDEALEIATSENDFREEMHPMERAAAYAAMQRDGASVAEISHRMGASKTVVAQQIALAKKTSQRVKDLFIAGKIDYDQLTAFTLFTLQEQDAFIEASTTRNYAPADREYKDLPKGVTLNEHNQPVDARGFHISHPYTPRPGAQPTSEFLNLGHADYIRRVANDKHIKLDRADFPVENYLAKGGAMSGGIFGADEYFENRTLFLECQQGAMEAMKDALEGAGERAYIEAREPQEQFFEAAEKSTVLYMDDNGRIHKYEDLAPILIKLSDYVPPPPVVEEKTKKVIANRKRIRLEDKAINRAVEKTLMDCPRKTATMFILGLLGLTGSRLSLQTPFSNPHDGYHDETALKTVAKFYDALSARGVKLGTTGTAKDGDPLRRLESRNADTLTAVRETLDTLSDSQLDGLVQCFMVLTLEPIVDGRIPETHQVVLEAYEPDKAEFFVRDEEYLQACNKSELVPISASFGFDHEKLTKKELVPFLRDLPQFQTYVPESLRPGVTPEGPAEDEAPFTAEAACEGCGVTCEYDGDTALCEQCQSEEREAA